MTKKTKYMDNPLVGCKKADKLREENCYREAISNYLRSIMLDRNNAKSYFGLGMCYKFTQNYSKAIYYLEKSAEIKEDYKTYFELGVCHLLKGIPCGAIKNFVKAVQLEPTNPEAILQLGLAHELCEEFDMALMIYQKLIETSPNFVKAYDCKSSLLMKMEQYREASLVLGKAIKLDPTYSQAIVGIGICFDKLGKKADAQRYYRKFLANEPNSSQASFVKTRMQKIRMQSGKTDLLALV